MQSTSIQWTDLSFNPIRAKRSDGKQRIPGHFCQKISPGCANCYASKTQPRFKMPMFPGVNKSPADAGVEVFLDEKALTSLLKRRKPARIFWCDMSDMFGEWVPFEWIDKCFAVMALTPHLTHQILTKRTERMAEYTNGDAHDRSQDVAASLGWISKGDDFRYSAWQWPLPNVHLGTSVEDQQRADERTPHLRKCPAAIRFLSVEPMLGPIPQLNLDGIHWVIAGGESGHGARPCNIDWIRSIVEQCKAAGVSCFVKQLGAKPFDSTRKDIWCDGEHHYTRPNGHHDLDEAALCLGYSITDHQLDRLLHDSKGGDIEEFPSDLRIRQFPATPAQEAR